MIERYNENPFTLSFGNVPFEQIKRNEEKEYLIKKIKSTPPMSHCFIIAGVRGLGKTVCTSQQKVDTTFHTFDSCSL